MNSGLLLFACFSTAYVYIYMCSIDQILLHKNSSKLSLKLNHFLSLFHSFVNIPHILTFTLPLLFSKVIKEKEKQKNIMVAFGLYLLLIMHLTLGLMMFNGEARFHYHHKRHNNNHKYSNHHQISMPPSPPPEASSSPGPTRDQNWNYTAGIYDVRMFGAIGDGVADDTEAFKTAWDGACGTDAGVLLVPNGYTFMIQSTIFTGPCQSAFVFQVYIITTYILILSDNIYFLLFGSLLVT